MVRKEDNFFSYFINDFAGKDSSELLRKEVIPKRETVTNHFLSASSILAGRRSLKRKGEIIVLVSKFEVD